MTRINNTTGSKAVIIRKNWSGFIAMYVQVYQGEEQVLDSKSYGTEKACIRWANKVLGTSRHLYFFTTKVKQYHDLQRMDSALAQRAQEDC